MRKLIAAFKMSVDGKIGGPDGHAELDWARRAAQLPTLCFPTR